MEIKMEATSKKYFWISLDLALFAVFIVLIFFVAPAVDRFGNSLPAARTIVVSAEGKTTATPDTANLSFSVVSQGKDANALSDINNKKMNDAIAYIKSQGIDAKNITTAGYNLNPNYEWNATTQRSSIIGYTLTQTVNVKISDLSKTAKIIAGLTPLGINEIGGVTFSIDNPESYVQKARQDAITKAKHKAEDIANAAGVSLGRVVAVSESQQGGPIPYYAQSLGAARDNKGPVPPTIEPGTQDIIFSVSITYELQ